MTKGTPEFLILPEEAVMKFSHKFSVNAPVADVAAFHSDTRALRQLTPFPIFAQIHDYEPLGEGSNARFTLWFGLLPVRWHAVHNDVTLNGFTDTQVSGPLKSWQHTHRFVPVGADKTIVEDTIIFEHDGGFRGLLSRLLFNKPGLLFLFSARKSLTRRGVRRIAPVKRTEALP